MKLHDWKSYIEQFAILFWTYVLANINDIEVFLESKNLDDASVMLIIGALLFLARKLGKDYSWVIDSKKLQEDTEKAQDIIKQNQWG